MSPLLLGAPDQDDGFVVDPIEVLLPTTLGGLDVVALLFGALAAGCVVALLATWLAGWVRERRTATSTTPNDVLLGAAAAASMAQLILLLVPHGPEGLATALTARQPATLLARLLLLAALALLVRSSARSTLATPVLLAVLMTTTVLAAPGLSTVGDLLVGGALGIVLLTVAAAALTALGSRPVARRVGIAAVVVAAAVPVVMVGLPEPPPPYHAERLVSDGIAFDITVAPVEPGRNEFHLYAWDEDAAEVDLVRAEVLLPGTRGIQRFELARVSPNHHLSYLLELTGPAPWPYQLEALSAEGVAISLTSTIEGAS